MSRSSFQNCSPEHIVRKAVTIAKRPIVTTKFGPYSACIIDVIMRVMPDMPVLWVDTGFNTTQTYEFVEHVKKLYDLNLHVYKPKHHSFQSPPPLGTKAHKRFTQEVKLEPFQRALDELQPDVWFTNLRKGQTSHRDQLDVYNHTDDGMLKVCPFYHWTDEEIENYLFENDLPYEFSYYDPTKVLEHRECGIHLS